MDHVRVFLFASLGALFAATASSAPAPEAPAAQATPLRANVLIGSPVHDASGALAGTVSDFWIDAASHRVTAVALDAHGQPQTCAVSRIDFTGEPEEAGRKPIRLPAGCVAAPKGAPSPGARRASEIVQSQVRDREGKQVGEVKDLYVDAAAARVTFALVDFVPSWFENEGWAAVPIASLQAQGEGYVATFDPEFLRPEKSAEAKAALAASRATDVRLSRLLKGGVVDAQGRKLGSVQDIDVDMQRNALAFVRVKAASGTVQCAVGAGGLTLRDDGFAAAGDLSSCAPAGAVAAGSMSASELLAASVRDSQDDRVGHLADVVVKVADARLHYLVAGFKAEWMREGDVAALPLRPVEREGGKPFVRASLMELQTRPVFERGRLTDVWSASFAQAMQKYLYGS